ncbi:MAG: ABC transporter substrate-binding protein [Crocosphaera sp.]|nr:ABC transporter substrate-binding protein [Crocosphaera sp.]
MFKGRSWKLFLALLFTTILIVTGLAVQEFNAKTQKSQLVLAIPNDPSTFNFAINRNPYSIFQFIYQGLLTQNGVTGKLEPVLAKNWQISADNLSIIFTLRDHLKWSDGEPLTVDDVVFTYNNIYLNQELPTVYKDILRIGNTKKFPLVEKVNNQQVRFSVSQPFYPLLTAIGELPILPRHALEESIKSQDSQGNLKFSTMWGTKTNPKYIISNGPYRLSSYTPTQRIILEKNPYYWRKDKENNQQPYIERLVLEIIESTDNQLIRFRSGELDNISVTPNSFALLKREEKKGKYTIYNGGVNSGVQLMGFNLNQASNGDGKPFVDPIKSRWFNNLSFRKAIAYSINRERMNNNIYRGLGEIQHSPLSIHSPYYLSPQEGLKTYNYNPKKAQEILINEGFYYNQKQQLLDDNGNQVKFLILVKSEDKSRIDTAIQIKEDLSHIGIQTDLQILNFNLVLKKLLVSRDWDCYVGAFSGGEVEPNQLFPMWNSRGSFHQFNQGPQPKETNIKGWKVSDWELTIDKLFIQGSQEFNETRRKQIYGEFQQIVVEQLPFFYLVNGLSLQAARDTIENVNFSAVGGFFWNLDELKINYD